MNPRERYLVTLTFGNPDKIPLSPGRPRESTLRRWHGEGLPAGVGRKEVMRHLFEVLGIEPEEPPRNHVNLGVNERMIPLFEEKVLEHKNNHYIVQDWKGNICEISDQYDYTYLRNPIDFVTRRWIKCPVENRDDWEQMKTRYNVDEPGRFPEDFAERCRQAQRRNYILSMSFPGSFWQLREWCGFERLCMMMIDEPDFVAEMAEFWTNFVSQMLERILEHITLDKVGFSEDMAYKAKAMISPAMMREFCKPGWDRWTYQIRSTGTPIVDMDSDGYIGEIIPLWIESGINACNPMEVAAGNDLNEFRRRFGHSIAYSGGIDKRAIAKGGQVIRDELKRLEPVLKDGGYIPTCDHGVPSDISWPNFVDYSRLLAKMTGWL